ncbi:hypothetical protein CYMTET_18095 [Cymbomonas tetramitiformis]|uniref:Uncharacterized protein n=1 Tax=Cymbomonas tetramitiformis TaxID=36881 RepID=A0AAE0G8S1_9CHLO|nr:hypothetical protein CYMTET_18095 [Cymbomonas tetramitiformis]|eukprot:gene19429-23230_t
MPIDYSKFDNIVDSDEETDAAPPPSGSAPTYTAEQRAAAEAAAASARQPPPADDPRAEIEKLKAAKRAQRQAREAAEGTKEETPEVVAPKVEEQAAPAEQGPLEMLEAAEKLQADILAEISAVEGALQKLVIKDSEAQTATQLLDRVTTMNGNVGKLQSNVDLIMIGELDDDVREGAKARRKKLNRALEEELMPTVGTLRGKVVKAKNAGS